MGSTTTIIAAIDSINVEINAHRATIEAATAEVTRLEAAREALGSLVSVDEAKVVRGAKRAEDAEVTETTQRRRRKSSDDTVKPAARKSSAKQTDDERKAVLREQRIANLAKARAAKADKANGTTKKASRKRSAKSSTNGNGHSPNRREQIIALLKKDMSPREIGTELGIAPNYVYHVKRSL